MNRIGVTLAAGLALAIAILGAALIITSWNRTATVLSQDDAPASRLELKSVAEKIESVSARLEALERAVDDVRIETAVTSQAVKSLAEEGVVAALPERNDESGPSDDATGHSALAEVAGSEESLRTFVAQVIEQQRQERQQRQRDEAQKRAQEWRDMRQGPYGRYNFKVNSLGKKLDLNEAQKQNFHDLAVHYEARRKELAKQVDMATKEGRERHRALQRRLQEDFERDFVQVLSPRQADEYESLPEWERQPGPGGQAMLISTTLSGEGAAAIEAGEGDAHVIIDSATGPFETPVAPVGADEDR